ncbi:hypothetical protein [Catalinimonas niigatensis]|uniref:hypothetical protein n=1 Tax=Catalinimonas niigatensis TaxID=1397264 RepID=UPI0026663E7C|nr:hypothetical protein [Catalinimonas niigatensis]WPP53611.1 hypothetical protein PZB72_14655 [Catalinimonas niigatensis]
MEAEELKVDPWMRGLLLLAGAYNLGWGFLIYVFPNSFYQWISQSEQNAPDIITWQGIGVIIFGIIYIAVALYPTTLWYLIALGIASKILGAAWFYWIVLEANGTRQYLFHLIMNDMIWVLPFAVILVRAYRVKRKKTAIIS